MNARVGQSLINIITFISSDDVSCDVIRNDVITDDLQKTYNILSNNCRQESLAIAKMTARCAQYMGALRSLRVLNTHPATFPEICKGLLFRSILRMCIRYKI